MEDDSGREACTVGLPLYSMNPSLRKRFIKQFIRERVVPTISASVSWLILGIAVPGAPSLPNRASSKMPGPALFTGIKKLVDQVCLHANIAGQQIGHENVRQDMMLMEHMLLELKMRLR
jgi:hypothetical protein